MGRLFQNRERKWIILLGSFLLLVGILYRVFPSFDELSPSSEDIALKEKKISAYQKKVAERDSLDAVFKDLNRTLAGRESGLLAGDKPPLAAVDIQNTIREITQRLGIEVSTMSVLKPIESETKLYLSIPVQFTFSATITQLTKLMHHLSVSAKILIVDGLRVVSSQQQKDGQIQSTMTVTGLMKADKS
ncbi:MAG: type II secretion system protein GspM [Syntrophales bacterium LBB04]|nr:type II secretion system protein GspM [Syntrophales bacterium LBB04]